MQASFRLLDVARQHLLLAVEAGELHVLTEQIQLQVGGVGLALQGGQRAFHAGTADRVAQFTAPVERLRKVDGVVLRPVGRIGAVGLPQPLAEDHRLSGKAAAQPDRKVGQPVGPGLLFADPCGILLQCVGLQGEALLNAQFEEPGHRQKERVALRGGRLQPGGRSQCKEKKVPICFPVHAVCGLDPTS